MEPLTPVCVCTSMYGGRYRPQCDVMSDFGIESMSEDEFRKAQIPRASKTIATEPRTRTVWFTLPTRNGFCTVSAHEEVQRTLNPEQKEYRDKYPVRSVFEITEDRYVCRDCFLLGADKEDTDG
jgi:hypothetical protein